ncbi:hypothetical protein OGAPHI_003988 [Ogataea philodendri]|uniref:Mitochondrial thiamine pyrophosphate carrier 1 n=1 Tax=Ogataea philodendri TaxID=1378263 RepID=A0A9P8P683_9ASCO|nr:uncharacterized protein OGAPHI_003988 [Ogataea philodendri]KAH3665800.1 hypothetical protein OGAPHI_003988 [Ogataea philodendri]
MSNSHLHQGVEVPAWISVIGGSVSGLVSRFVIAPADTVKIRQQLNGNQDKYRGVSRTIRTILHNEGIRAFWKGNLPAEIMYLLYGATQFATYSSLNNMLTQTEQTLNIKVPSSVHALALGSLSGSVSIAISYPFDVLRTRLAANETRQFRSFVKETSEMYYKDGVRSFFRGIQLSITSVAISMGLSFGSYSYFRDLTANTPFESTSGLLAGILSKTLVYPLDLVRRRKHMTYRGSFAHAILQIIAKEGVRGAYHGLTPALIKSAPTTAISFWCYEWTVDWLLSAQDRFN